MNERSGGNPYIKYSPKTKYSSTLEFVEKSKATHYLIGIPTEKIHASNFVRIPQTMGDLKDVQSTDQFSLTDSLLAVLTKSIAGKATLPLIISIYITQTSKDDKKVSQEFFLIKTNSLPKDIVLKKKVLTKDAFEKWMEYREKCITNGTFETDINLAVVAIVLREGVQSVPDSAFCDMDKVEHVSLPNSLKVIGEEAFCGCLSLQEITIPPNVEEMYDGAFLLCESLTEITIPPKIERLRAYVLSGCTGLKEIRVPKTVKWIEEEALLAEGAQRLVSQA